MAAIGQFPARVCSRLPGIRPVAKHALRGRSEIMAEGRPSPLVAGNWKMNGLMASAQELQAIATGVADGAAGRAELLICPPVTLVAPFAWQMKDKGVAIGGQDCHPDPGGAHTGD